MLVIALLFGAVAGGINLALASASADTQVLLNIGYGALMTVVLVLLGSQGWHQFFNQALKHAEQLPDVLKRMQADPNLIQLATLMLAILKAVEANTEEVPPAGGDEVVDAVMRRMTDKGF